jgi:hypothetical protein
VKGVDEDPRTEKQQGFEGGMGGQVKHAGNIIAGGKTHDHQPQLTDGGIGPDLFDVAADHGHGGGDQHADGADRQADA